MASNKPPKNYNLLKDIRQDELYKSNVIRRNKSARKIIEEKCTEDVNKVNSILPGQLIMFNYFEPKTKEELEYYDAQPCTIFFGVFMTKEHEKRVMGFNIHYYPPRIRYQLMDRVFEIYKSSYTKQWSKPLKKEIPVFYPELFIYQLQKAKLDFGIRMYIPKLMNTITPIPSSMWHKAVFTEGAFKKRTREAILNYWKQKKIDTEFVNRARARKQKSSNKQKSS